MSDLPPPPVPAECDLRGMEWFPLHHQRLQRSVWWRTASHMARACNIDMWMAAYCEVPAGSLPDDDRALALAAGFFRDVQGFQAVKAELLETWRLHADGRWYQPVLAEICVETWLRLSDKRRQDRERKARRRAAIAGGQANVPQVSHRTPTGLPPENGTQDKTGQDTTDSVVPAAPKPAGGWEADESFCSAWDACTKAMRQRSKSRERTWPIWKKAAAATGPDRLLAALRAYLRGHKDLERTGGPGLHKWLSDGTYEHWLPAEPALAPACDPLDEWRAIAGEYSRNAYWPGDMGPRPGRPGCRCPPDVLTALNLPSTPMANAKETQP